MGVRVRACVALLTTLLVGGCITTFQTADVLPTREKAFGVGYGFPFYGEVSLRRGIGWNSDVAVRAALGVSPIPDWNIYPMVSGELKYQILSPPYPALAFILGGGAVMRGAEFAYPTLLGSYGPLYLGARYILSQGGEPLRGAVAGLALGPYKGYIVLPEVNISLTQLGEPYIFAALGVQYRWQAKDLEKK